MNINVNYKTGSRALTMNTLLRNLQRAEEDVHDISAAWHKILDIACFIQPTSISPPHTGLELWAIAI